MIFPLVLERVWLRPFEESDEESIVKLSGDPDASWGTRSITYPESPEKAPSWLKEHRAMTERGETLSLAIISREQPVLVGAVILFFEPLHDRAEIGCWIGKPYRYKGYGSEACRAVIDYAFEKLKLNKVCAYCLARNIPSVNMIRKLGMKFEGCLRKHLKVRGIYEDLLVYGLLAGEKEDNAQQG
ncbi:GNAT family N-acetyltransferase [Candidatus Methylacidiphilum infernorum]|uniref:GNAT family N-acetyltransferase n=1 Tax=Candidatus Methylacidiphilum infernorum TaxID=511746 RepID=A0ABX7PX11_9BACT|nr:GNAT family N-acetyltransferase [Candidatus Methylacidiphilum infernorum]QSR87560.1 GNAT family N-acetyltransferase [Candidatus Methylacidiphilum infernorum]